MNTIRRHSPFLRIALTSVAVTLIMEANAWAEATNRVVAPLSGSSATLDAGTSVLRMMGSLAIVLALFFGGVWVWRRSQTWQRGGRAARLQVVETRSLGTRQSLAVVGYDRQRFLVSCTPAGVTMLTILPDESTATALPTDAPVQEKPALPSFAQALATAWGRR